MSLILVPGFRERAGPMALGGAAISRGGPRPGWRRAGRGAAGKPGLAGESALAQEPGPGPRTDPAQKPRPGAKTGPRPTNRPCPKTGPRRRNRAVARKPTRRKNRAPAQKPGPGAKTGPWRDSTLVLKTVIGPRNSTFTQLLAQLLLAHSRTFKAHDLSHH